MLLNANIQAFSVGRCNTSQYLRCFIPATTRLWNELPSCIVESQELQRVKIDVNTYLLSDNCNLFLLLFKYFYII